MQAWCARIGMLNFLTPSVSLVSQLVSRPHRLSVRQQPSSPSSATPRTAAFNNENGSMHRPHWLHNQAHPWQAGGGPHLVACPSLPLELALSIAANQAVADGGAAGGWSSGGLGADRRRQHEPEAALGLTALAPPRSKEATAALMVWGCKGGGRRCRPSGGGVAAAKSNGQPPEGVRIQDTGSCNQHKGREN
jgi:hypothetical protein